MDYEGGLISGVVLEGNIVDALDLGVNPELFATYTGEWKFIQEYYLKHGIAPTPEIFGNKFKGFELKKYALPYSVLLEEMRKRFAHKLISKTVKESVDYLKKKDPLTALESFKKMVRESELTVSESRDLDLSSTTRERKLKYLQAKTCGGIDGYLSPWTALDDVTLGWNPGEIWMIVARSGIGKSWCISLLLAHFWGQGIKSDLVTEEMEPSQLARRIDCIVAKVSHKRFKEGRLKQREEERLFETWEEMERRIPAHVIGGSGGISEIESKVEKYNPHILLIDGLYMIPDERNGNTLSEKINHVSEDLQKLGKRRKLLIIVTHQFNLEGKQDKGTADTLAHGDIQKWYDGILGMYHDDALKKQMLFKLLKHREGELTRFVGEWDLENMKFASKKSHKEIKVDEQTDF